MPWRLFLALLLSAILIVFIGLNLDNRTSVSFGFYVFNDVPVFVSMFVSFICGALVMLPFTFGRKKKKPAKAELTANKKEKDSPQEIAAPKTNEDTVVKKQKKKLFERKKSNKAAAAQDEQDV